MPPVKNCQSERAGLERNKTEGVMPPLPIGSPAWIQAAVFVEIRQLFASHLNLEKVKV
jgi:hypothetical protein